MLGEEEFYPNNQNHGQGCIGRNLKLSAPNSASNEMVLKFEGCVRYVFACSFLILIESSCQTRKNFTSKDLFVLKKIKLYNFRFSNFMTSLNV